MKTIKILLTVSILALFTASCVSDDPLARVKYQISGLDNHVAEIKYKDATGYIIDVLTNGNINTFAGGSDTKSIAVNNTPFDASLQVTVNNTSATAKEYVLVIYVGNEAKATKNFSAPPSAISTEQVVYTVE